jgi:hypothetical protein
LISLHAPTDEEKILEHFPVSAGSCTNWLREFALPNLQKITEAKDNIILGGVTNCARSTGAHFRDSTFTDAHLAFSEEFGYTEALWERHGKEIPTYRRKTRNNPHSDWFMCNDHFFLKGPLSTRIQKCEVIHEPDPPGSSAPVLLTLSD